MLNLASLNVQFILSGLCPLTDLNNKMFKKSQTTQLTQPPFLFASLGGLNQHGGTFQLIFQV